VDELRARPIGEKLRVKTNTMASAWSYFREEREVTLVRIEKLTHDSGTAANRHNYRSALERELIYFSAEPIVYNKIPLSIRQSPAKLAQFRENVWRSVNVQLKGSINNNADDVINLTVDDRDEEPMEEDSPRQNMAEKLGLCFSDESDADDENNPATSTSNGEAETTTSAQSLTLEFLHDVDMSEEEEVEDDNLEDSTERTKNRKSTARKKMELLTQMDNAFDKSSKFIEPNLKRMEKELSMIKDQIKQIKKAQFEAKNESEKTWCDVCESGVETHFYDDHLYFVHGIEVP